MRETVNEFMRFMNPHTDVSARVYLSNNSYFPPRIERKEGEQERRIHGFDRAKRDKFATIRVNSLRYSVGKDRSLKSRLALNESLYYKSPWRQSRGANRVSATFHFSQKRVQLSSDYSCDKIFRSNFQSKSLWR